MRTRSILSVCICAAATAFITSCTDPAPVNDTPVIDTIKEQPVDTAAKIPSTGDTAGIKAQPDTSKK